jgi:hypothetical protein
LTDATLEARTLLWEWVSIGGDEDPERRASTARYAECLIDAGEHAGLLPADEVVQWRRLLDHGEVPPPVPGDRHAAERHLEQVHAAVRPRSRNPEPAALEAARRFHAALEALHEPGVLSDEAERRWRSRGLAAEAPWLDHDEIAQLTSMQGACGLPDPARPRVITRRMALPATCVRLRGHVRSHHVRRVLAADVSWPEA